MSVQSGLLNFILFYFLLLLLACDSNSTPKNIQVVNGKRKITIGLLPYKGFDTGFNNFLQKETSEFYQCDVIVLPQIQLPNFAYYALRGRYKADSLLVFEKKLKFENVDYIAGLTNKDISTSNGNISDWGVFGLGYCPGKACVISTFRLQRASKTNQQLKERLAKVVLHEIGHNLGLPHCAKNAECLMTDAAGTIKQVDKEKKWLCESCILKLGR